MVYINYSVHYGVQTFDFDYLRVLQNQGFVQSKGKWEVEQSRRPSGYGFQPTDNTDIKHKPVLQSSLLIGKIEGH